MIVLVFIHFLSACVFSTQLVSWERKLKTIVILKLRKALIITRGEKWKEDEEILLDKNTNDENKQEWFNYVASLSSEDK